MPEQAGATATTAGTMPTEAPGAEGAEPESAAQAGAPRSPAQERARRSAARHHLNAQLARQAAQQILNTRARALWGRDGPQQLAEKVSALGKGRHPQALDAAMNGHDALERHVLLTALLLTAEEQDPWAQPARRMLASLEASEKDTIQALRNTLFSFSAADAHAPADATRLRRIYAGCARAAKHEQSAAHAAAAGLLQEFGTEQFDSAFRALKAGAEVDLRAQTPSRYAARLHTALTSSATMGLVRDARRFGSDCKHTLASRQMLLQAEPPELAAKALKAFQEGRTEAADFLHQVLGEAIASAVLAQAWLLSQMHLHVSQLSLQAWPEQRLASRLQLLDSLLHHVPDAEAQLTIESARNEARLREQAWALPSRA